VAVELFGEVLLTAVVLFNTSEKIVVIYFGYIVEPILMPAFDGVYLD